MNENEGISFFFRPPFGSACQLFGRGWNWNEIDYIFSLALAKHIIIRSYLWCLYIRVLLGPL